MSDAKLKYLSEATLENLRKNIKVNLERYHSGDFIDFEAAGGWSIELKLKVDLDCLNELEPEGDAEAEIKNSWLLWIALGGLTPSLACEERMWVRLAHIECPNYSRKRWLHGREGEILLKSIDTHFFANTQTKMRVDNALSRLWWNAYIAKRTMPDDPEIALRLILQKADFRSNFVERSRTVSRPKIAAGIVRTMRDEPWITGAEQNFRNFMIVLNRQGGGVLFEIMSAADVDTFMTECVISAKAAVNTAA